MWWKCIVKMSEVRMRRRSKVVLVGLLVIGILAASGMGCNSYMSSSVLYDSSEPFITDRVVEVRIIMTEDNWATCRLDALQEQYVLADFWFDGELIPNVAVRPKGNSSLSQVFRTGSPRLSLKVDFNFFNSARTFRGLKKLNFNNGFNDPTLIRECIAYEIFAQMNIPTPRTSFVDLWVNDTHLGLYTQVEQVDKTFLRRHFSDAGGNLYKPEMPAAFLSWTEANLGEQEVKMGFAERYNSDLVQQINMGGAKLAEIIQALEQQNSLGYGLADPGLLRANPSSNKPQGYLEQMGLKTNENFPDHSALFHFLDVLNNEPDETFPAEIEKILDVDEALRFIAVSTLVGYYDSYLGIGHNYYLYEVDGKFTIIPWDLNGAFASFTGGMSRKNIINCYIDEPTCGPIADRPFIDRLLSHQPYLDKYHEYLETLLGGPFYIEMMEARIDEVADLVRPFVYDDELKFYSTKDFERGLNEDVLRRGLLGNKTHGGAPPLPKLSPESLACLQSKFDKRTLDELRERRPSVEELAKLKSCLSREEVAELLRRGPSMEVPPQDLVVFATIIGLKTYIVERVASVRQQLDGKRPSAGDGSGNGGNPARFGGMDMKPDIYPPGK